MRPRSRRRAATMQPAATNCSGGIATCSTHFPGRLREDLRPRSALPAGHRAAPARRSRSSAARASTITTSTTSDDLAGVDAARRRPTIIPPDGTDPGTPLTTCPRFHDRYCGNPADQVGDQGEATLDVQRAGSVAPGATIKLIVSAKTELGRRHQHRDRLRDRQRSGAGEDPQHQLHSRARPTTAARSPNRLDEFFAQAAAEGISVFVASGDAGVAGCASLDAAPHAGRAEQHQCACARRNTSPASAAPSSPTQQNPDRVLVARRTARISSQRSATSPKARGTSRSTATAIRSSRRPAAASAPIFRRRHGRPAPACPARRPLHARRLARTRRRAKVISPAWPRRAVRAHRHAGPIQFHRGRRHVGVDAEHGRHRRAPEPEDGHGAGQPQSAALCARGEHGRGGVPRRHGRQRAASRAARVAVPSLCNNSTPGPSGLTGGLAGFMVGTGYDDATGLGSVDATNLITHWSGYERVVQSRSGGPHRLLVQPGASGQGIVMQVMPDFYGAGQGLLFGGWFTFDVTAAGGQRWYSVQGAVSDRRARRRCRSTSPKAATSTRRRPSA